MKKQMAAIGLMCGLMFTTGLVCAADEPSAMADEQVSAPVEVGNTICPVSKEKVGQMGDIVKVEYNGKIYNFCCKMCLKDFNKDPEKFSKIAEEQAAKVKANDPDAMAGAVEDDHGEDDMDHMGH